MIHREWYTGEESLPQPATTEYILGLDLGQSRDFSAWVLVERTKYDDQLAKYHVRHIDRIRDQSYPAIVRHTATLVTALMATLRASQGDRRIAPQRPPRVSLIVDYTGVGRPVADLLTDADLGVEMQLVTITGADQTTQGESGDWRVPKRVLASTVQVGLQTTRLTIEPTLTLAKTLTAELQNFKVKIALNGHDSYGAAEEWREGNNDDLVLSLALALWWGDARPGSWDDLTAADIAAWARLGAARR